jgi:alkyl hydroperoxide reductase subunit D
MADEVTLELLERLKIPADFSNQSVQAFSNSSHRYPRDLRINVNNVLSSDNLEEKEAYLLALSIAVNEKNDVLIKSFAELSESEGATPDEIAEVHACASLLAANNVFYRFKHFIKDSNDSYQQMPARIKMNIMAKPVLGKEFFELMSLAISAVNGCEMCVNAHEASVRKLGANEARVFDTVRLASLIRGLCLVIR